MKFSITQGITILAAGFVFLAFVLVDKQAKVSPVPDVLPHVSVPVPDDEDVDEKTVVSDSEDNDAVDVFDWVEYRNEELGFLFAYPKGWELHDGGVGLIASASSLEQAASEYRSINMFWRVGDDGNISERIDIGFGSGEIIEDVFRSDVSKKETITKVGEIDWGEGRWLYLVDADPLRGIASSDSYIAAGFSPDALATDDNRDLSIRVTGFSFDDSEIPDHVITAVRLISATFEFID